MLEVKRASYYYPGTISAIARTVPYNFRRSQKKSLTSCGDWIIMSEIMEDVMSNLTVRLTNENLEAIKAMGYETITVFRHKKSGETFQAGTGNIDMSVLVEMEKHAKEKNEPTPKQEKLSTRRAS